MERTFYTDGSAKNNGALNATGGYGAIEIVNNKVVWQYQEMKTPTTNNEMELSAILKVLEHCLEEPEPQERQNIIIYSDSKYCCETINEWMYNWAKNGWKRQGNNDVKNLDIIQKIFIIIEKSKSFESKRKFKVKKVQGHAGNQWNNYVDLIATGKIVLPT